MEIAQDEKIKQLEEQIRQEHEQYLRALADFDNFRKRIDRERASTASAGKRQVILGLLEVLDGFERALQHAEEASSSFVDGIRTIYRSFTAFLEQQKVVPIASVGEQFDPKIHEAVDSAAGSAHEPGTVIQEFQRGYRLGDELLRPARVRVAS